MVKKNERGLTAAAWDSNELHRGKNYCSKRVVTSGLLRRSRHLRTCSISNEKCGSVESSSSKFLIGSSNSRWPSLKKSASQLAAISSVAKVNRTI